MWLLINILAVVITLVMFQRALEKGILLWAVLASIVFSFTLISISAQLYWVII